MTATAISSGGSFELPEMNVGMAAGAIYCSSCKFLIAVARFFFVKVAIAAGLIFMCSIEYKFRNAVIESYCIPAAFVMAVAT